MALHELTIKAIRRAQKQGGIIDPIEDWDAIAALDAQARSSTELTVEDRVLFLDLPMIVGGIELYRLSWAASDWLTLALDWFAGDARMLDISLVWAHAKARQKAEFRRCATREAAEEELIRWSLDCGSSIAAMLAALEKLAPKKIAGEPGKEKTVNERMSNGPILDHMMEKYHQPVDYFLWDISAEELNILIRASALKSELQASAMEEAAGKAPDASGRMARETIKFQRAAKAFVAMVLKRGEKS